MFKNKGQNDLENLKKDIVPIKRKNSQHRNKQIVIINIEAM